MSYFNFLIKRLHTKLYECGLTFRPIQYYSYSRKQYPRPMKLSLSKQQGTGRCNNLVSMHGGDYKTALHYLIVNMVLVEPKALVPFGSYRKRSFAGHQSTPGFTVDGGRSRMPCTYVCLRVFEFSEAP